MEIDINCLQFGISLLGVIADCKVMSDKMRGYYWVWQGRTKCICFRRQVRNEWDKLYRPKTTQWDCSWITNIKLNTSVSLLRFIDSKISMSTFLITSSLVANRLWSYESTEFDYTVSSFN